MYKDLKVTSGEVAANNVKSAPDRLQGTATENKNVFDKLVELFVGKYNDLLDELDDNEMSAVPPITINGYTISHANSGVTQGMYGTDQEQYPQHGEKFIVPYIIVDEHGHIVSAGNSEVQLPSGGGGGTSDYDDLTDKPSINSVTLSGNKSASDLSLASASHTHTKSDISDFPSLATVATTGDYDDLSDKPSIPTKTSDLNNDSLFLRGDTAGVYRGTSTTSGSTGTKSVTCSNFTSSQLQIGVLVMVDFTHDNSASVDDLKLNVNATGAKGIRMMKNGHVSKLPATSFIQTIRTYPFYYDGDYWIMIVDSTPTKVSELTNDSGFLASESDPVFTASPAYGISSSDITAWNGKSTVSLNRKTTSGTNIADLTINGTTTQLYAPTSGGATSYDDLSNRPQINSTTLTGNKTLTDLGMKTEILNLFYPVGSYYETSDISFDPEIAWGGEWQLETEGQVHVSGSANGTYQINGATTDTNDAGSAQITYTPTGSNSAVTLSGAQSGVQAHAHTASASGGKVGSHAHEPSNTDYQFLAVASSGASVGRHTVGTSGTSSNSYIHTATAVARHNATESVAPSFTQPTITVNNATAKGATKSHNHTFTGTQVQLDNMQPYIVVNRWHRTA